MFLSEMHKKSFVELTEKTPFLNKGQLFILAYDERLYKLFLNHCEDTKINWKAILEQGSNSNDDHILFELMMSFESNQDTTFNTDRLHEIKNVDYLKVALNALYAHFSLDVYPYEFSTPKTGESIIHDSQFLYPVPEERLISQKEIVDLFNKNGIDGDRRKVSVYKNKGYLPEPAVKAGAVDLWKESSIKEWIKDYNSGKIVKRRNRKNS